MRYKRGAKRQVVSGAICLPPSSPKLELRGWVVHPRALTGPFYYILGVYHDPTLVYAFVQAGNAAVKLQVTADTKRYGIERVRNAFF